MKSYFTFSRRQTLEGFDPIDSFDFFDPKHNYALFIVSYKCSTKHLHLFV